MQFDNTDSELPPISSLQGVCCFVGSQTFRLSEADATRAYKLKNPNWPGTFGIAVLQATAPLGDKYGPEQACTLACLQRIAAQVKNHTIVVQTMMVRNAASPTERIPICFATAFGPGDQTKVLMLEEDPIPY
jgi:hypothetical protein